MMPEFFRLTRCGVAGGARYTPDVAARKQVRGVMLSQFTVSEDDFRTLKEWNATVARYQMYPVGERWKGKTSDTEGFASWFDWKLGVLKGETLPLARASYTLAADDLYVRARVESNESATYPNAISKMHPPMKVGWTQPYRKELNQMWYIRDVSV